MIQGTLHDYTGGTSDRFEPKPGFDEEIIRETAGSAREGFAWAFRQAALLVLSVLPLMGALKRTPAQAQAEFMERMKAQQAAGGGGAPGAQAPGGNGGDRPDGDGAEPDGDGAPARPAARPGPEPRPA